MVVEDAENLRFLYRDELVEAGYEVILAANGKEALKQLDKFKPDLVILDIVMPLMDGMEPLGKYKKGEAITAYNKTIAKIPYHAEVHLNLVDAHAAKGNMNDAVSEFRLAIRLNPRSIDARNRLGQVLERMGRLEEAIRQYQASIEVDPDRAETYNFLGGASFKMGMHAEALSACGKAIEINPTYPEAFHKMGLAYMSMGRLNTATDAGSDPAAVEKCLAAASTVRLKSENLHPKA